MRAVPPLPIYSMLTCIIVLLVQFVVTTDTPPVPCCVVSCRVLQAIVLRCDYSLIS